MLRVLTCVLDDHNPWLLGLALMIGAASSCAAFQMLVRAGVRRQRAGVAWALAAGLSAGLGVWATHFVAMTAYAEQTPLGFAVGPLLASVGLSLGLLICAFLLLHAAKHWVTAASAGLLAAAAIAGMHYLGTAGLTVPAFMVWQPDLVGASLVLGFAAATAATLVFARSRMRFKSTLAGMLFAAAVASTHFIGMSALTLVPTAIDASTLTGLSRVTIGFAVAGGAIILLGGAVAATLVDLKMADRQARENDHLRQAIGQLSISEERYAIAEETGQIGIIDADHAKRTIWFSPVLRQWHALPASIPYDTALTTLLGHIHADDQLAARDLFRRTLRGEAMEADFRAACPGGGHRWRRVSTKTFVGEHGQATRMIVALRDVHDLVETAKRAQEANTLKTEFLANVSHEIRTPMNGVIGMAQLLEQTRLDPKQVRYAGAILSSSRSLLSLLNDILDIARMEAGELTLDADWIDASHLIEGAIASVKGLADEKDIVITADLGPGSERSFKGDGERLRQVLVNLLGNALKFSTKGPVTVRSRILDAQIQFEVQDCGIGIPAAQQAFIFEPFRQADGSATRRYGGTGLGLSICKRLVDLMGGEISVTSTEGQGSTFRVSIRPSWAPASPASETASIDKGGLTALRVLIAEDNRLNQIVLREVLRALSIRSVTIVENGQLALEALEKAPFDLVLMDINMPVMSGDEAIRQIRASKAAFATVPIFVVTANAMAGDRERYLQDGADDFVAKPIDLPDLQEKLLRLSAKRQRSPQPERSLKVANAKSGRGRALSSPMS